MRKRLLRLAPGGTPPGTDRTAAHEHVGCMGRAAPIASLATLSGSLPRHAAGPMEQPRPMSRFLEQLRDRVLFFDGGMGTQVQARELSPEDYGGKRWEGCIDQLSLTRPDVVEAIHTAYLEAGADVIETNSFQASRTRLEEWGLGERTVDLNRAAAAVARRAADRFA